MFYVNVSKPPYLNMFLNNSSGIWFLCKSCPNLTNMNTCEYCCKIETSLGSKYWEISFVRDEGLIYLKNVTCPDSPLIVHLNSKNWNCSLSFWSQLSSTQPLISSIWQLILTTI